jgi:hypothetical protein
MAINAVLVGDEHPSWGRSYMEHLVALCDDLTVPEAVRSDARRLRDTPPEPPALLQIGKADRTVEAAAAGLVDWARERVAMLSSGETDR